MPTRGDARHPLLALFMSGDGRGLSQVCLLIPALHQSGSCSSLLLAETPTVLTLIFVLMTAGGSGSCESFDRDNEEACRIFIFGCTNCPWDIDDAIMQRFQKRIHVPVPDDCSKKGPTRRSSEKGG